MEWFEHSIINTSCCVNMHPCFCFCPLYPYFSLWNWGGVRRVKGKTEAKACPASHILRIPASQFHRQAGNWLAGEEKTTHAWFTQQRDSKICVKFMTYRLFPGGRLEHPNENTKNSWLYRFVYPGFLFILYVLKEN